MDFEVVDHGCPTPTPIVHLHPIRSASNRTGAESSKDFSVAEPAPTSRDQCPFVLPALVVDGAVYLQKSR